MATTFQEVFKEKLGSVSLTEVANEMAAGGGKEENILTSLSRFHTGKRTPGRKNVDKIADALASFRKMSKPESDQLRSDLLRAAGYGDPRFSDLKVALELELSEEETRRRLRPKCEDILSNNGYSENQVARILDVVGASTMRLIIDADKAGEKIEVGELGQFGKVDMVIPERVSSSDGVKRGRGETVIAAGRRANITVSGKISGDQMKVLQNAAQIIESVLRG